MFFFVMWDRLREIVVIRELNSPDSYGLGSGSEYFGDCGIGFF